MHDVAQSGSWNQGERQSVFMTISAASEQPAYPLLAAARNKRLRLESVMMERVSEEIKEAMKAKDKARLDALRLLKSALIENNTSSKPKPDIEVAIGHVKKLKDSLESFPAGSPELAKINAEIAYLAVYVPTPMSKEQLESLVRDFLSHNPAADFGQVMKAISPEIKGRFDGRAATDIIKAILVKS
jgi:uncharacterized protein YqeY